MYAQTVPPWADQLLPQLLIEQFDDTLPSQFRHIEHMHEGVWFDKMTAMRQFFRYKLLIYRTFRCEYFCVFHLNKCSRLQALRSFSQILLKSYFHNWSLLVWTITSKTKSNKHCLLTFHFKYQQNQQCFLSMSKKTLWWSNMNRGMRFPTIWQV